MSQSILKQFVSITTRHNNPSVFQTLKYSAISMTRAIADLEASGLTVHSIYCLNTLETLSSHYESSSVELVNLSKQMLIPTFTPNEIHRHLLSKILVCYAMRE